MTRISRIHYSCVLAASYLLGLVTGRPQNPSPSSSDQPSSTTSSAVQTHTIGVGSGDHKFKPDVVQAEVGDIIQFNFFPTNHSVVRAEYGFPCIPYEMSGEDKVGFFSGFNHVEEISSNPPTYTIRINDTNSIFFYCSAPTSCTKYGMVGAINPNSSTPLSTQRQLALNAAYQLTPGEPFPAEGSPAPSPIPTDNPDSTHPPTSPSTSTSSFTSTPPSPPHHTPTLKPAAIAGIVVAGLAVLALAGALFFYIGRSKSLSAEVVRKASTIRHPSPPSPSAGMMYKAPMSGGGSGVVPGGYLSPKLDGSGYAGGSIGTHGVRSPDAVYQSQPQRQQYGVDRSTSLRSEGYGREGDVLWEKEAEVPLGPYGLQVYEKSYPTHVNPTAPSEMDGREVGQRI